MAYDPFEDARKWLYDGMEEMKAKAVKEQLRQEFEKLNLKEIGKKNEAQLILWRSGFPEDSPHYQFATHALEKKKLYRNLKWLAVIALIGTSATIFVNVYKSNNAVQEKTISHAQEENNKPQAPSQHVEPKPATPPTVKEKPKESRAAAYKKQRHNDPKVMSSDRTSAQEGTTEKHTVREDEIKGIRIETIDVNDVPSK